MKHALNDSTITTLPTTPPGGLTAGLDWAKDDHVVCVLDTIGQVRERFTIEHSSAGLRSLGGKLDKLGCREVAIERPDGPVVEALVDATLTVVVISPSQVKNLRSRYGSAGNKNDRFDAYVLADTLRTDRLKVQAAGLSTARRSISRQLDRTGYQTPGATHVASSIGRSGACRSILSLPTRGRTRAAIGEVGSDARWSRAPGESGRLDRRRRTPASPRCLSYYGGTM